jgi:hypothetical protein
MYVTCHNRYSFRMDGAKIPEIQQNRIITQRRVETAKHVRVLEQMNEKCFAGFLQSKDRRTLPTKPSISVFATGVGDHVKRDIAHLPTYLSAKNRSNKGRGGEPARVPRAQRGACAGAGPCSSDTSGFHEGRPCPVCTAVFSQARHLGLCQNNPKTKQK